MSTLLKVALMSGGTVALRSGGTCDSGTKIAALQIIAKKSACYSFSGVAIIMSKLM
jgi:hypothetical protein